MEGTDETIYIFNLTVITRSNYAYIDVFYIADNKKMSKTDLLRIENKKATHDMVYCDLYHTLEHFFDEDSIDYLVDVRKYGKDTIYVYCDTVTVDRHDCKETLTSYMENMKNTKIVLVSMEYNNYEEYEID